MTSDRADRAPGPPPPPPPWWTRPGLATAVALLLAAALGGGAWWQAWHASPNAVDAEVLRAAAVAAEQIPLVAPEVTAGGDARLAWRAVPGAMRYHVEVLGADGAVVHAASTADTVLALPATLRPPAGAAYEWSVRTRLPDGVTRRSAAGRLLGAR